MRSLICLMRYKSISKAFRITSNIQVGIVEDYSEHPARRILDSGIVACLNTDDPAISGIDLHHEIQVAANRAGLTPEHTRAAQANALEMAFLSDSEKRALANRKGGLSPS